LAETGKKLGVDQEKMNIIQRIPAGGVLDEMDVEARAH
jgi:hypothetical protein